jgi:hypothetical protein
MDLVYSNAWLTIASQYAESTDVGFLNPRDPGRYLSAPLCPIPDFPDHYVWIRWPSGISRPGEILSTRGWTFQEMVLSPRILEYTSRQLEWNCNQGDKEETEFDDDEPFAHDLYKGLMWLRNGSNLPQHSPEHFLQHPQYPNYQRSISIYRRWYLLIQGYSHRKLTKPTDRLPAMAGLAREMQKINGDTYLAGTWKRDIAAGLAWYSNQFELPEAPEYVAPSWSWASRWGAVGYSDKLDDDVLGIDLLSADVVSNEFNPFGEVYSASLTLSSRLRQFNIAEGTVHVNYLEWDKEKGRHNFTIENDEQRKSPEYYRYQRDYMYRMDNIMGETNPHGNAVCLIRSDSGNPPPVSVVWCLNLLGDGKDHVPKKASRSSDEYIPDGLVLERVHEKSNIFKRIGVYSVCDIDEEKVDPANMFLYKRFASMFPGTWEKSVLTLI